MSYSAVIDDTTAPQRGPGNAATLAFLLRRMRQRSDFPALSESLARILHTVDSDDESLAGLTNEILKDVALTQKILRVVNSVQFVHVGQGTISTVSRAVSLVGFNTVRNLALSLVLLDHMENKAHAQLLKQEFVRSLMAGAVAAQLEPSSRTSEGAFLGAMFQNLGRMLTVFYFREEAEAIDLLLLKPDFSGGEKEAALQVLGIDFDDLAAGVATAWGLPDALQRSMCRPGGPAPSVIPADPVERMRWIGACANDVARAATEHEHDGLAAPLHALSRRYAAVLRGLQSGARHDVLERAAAEARSRTIALTDAMHLQIDASSPAARILEPADGNEPEIEEPGASQPAAGSVAAMRQAYGQARAVRAQTAPAEASEPASAQVRASEIMSAGVQEIVNTMAGTFRLDDVLRMVMETMLRGLSLRTVVFCLRDREGQVLQGRFGLGEGQAAAVRALRVPLGASDDLFAAACRKAADLFIADAVEERTARRLPEWYRQHFQTGAFILLPVVQNGKPLGLLYADHAEANGIRLDDKGFALLRTLRNQALMALRQGG
jgi:HD-like signal output (HDOD) protein